MKTNQNITSSVRRFLKKSKWTQRKLAAQMNISECVLSSLLSGRRNWTLNLVVAFTEATNQCVTL